MATATDYTKQLEKMRVLPDYRNVIADAYKDPIIKPITGEAQRLESQYLPTIFDTFANIGTGAGDMSAAAKLQMIGKNLGQLGSRVTTNRDVQNFFNTQIQDLANVETQRWQQRYNKLKDLWQMQFQQEEAERRAAEAAAARAAARAAQAAQANHLKSLMDKYRTAGGEAAIGVDPKNFTSVDQLNAYRASSGKPPVSQEYFVNTYNPAPIEEPSYPEALLEMAHEYTQSDDPWTKIKGYATIPGAAILAAPGRIADWFKNKS